MAIKTAVYGGNQAKFFAFNTISNALGSVLFSYDKLQTVTKTDTPALGTYSIALQNADITSAHDTFINTNLKEVTDTAPIDIQYNNNTKDSLTQAPPDTTKGFLISASGEVGGTSHRLHILYGYLSAYSETDDSNGTPIFTTDTYQSLTLSGSTTITDSSINTYFSNLGTKTGNVVIADGGRGAITHITI